MKVADLVEALQTCDPKALVLVPAAPAASQASKPVVDVTPGGPAHSRSGQTAQGGAVRLTKFPLM